MDGLLNGRTNVHPSNIDYILKQAENGLQSRSSENGKTAVWDYGSRLAWMTGMADWHG